VKWNLWGNNNLLIAASSVTSAAVGAAVGYVVANRLLEKKFQEQLRTEVEDARSYFQQMYSTPTFVADEPVEEEKLLEEVKDATEETDGMPVDLVGRALEALEEYKSDSPEAEPGDDRVPAPVIVNNIFQNRTPPGEEVLDALLRDRDPSKPYIITKVEFYENEPEHEQRKFTYWEGDDVLVDDQEEYHPIDDIDLVAGEDNLLHFGYGSGDEAVLYVRNENADPPLDLHITLSSGKYANEVMGLDDNEPHLRHAQPRKFRIKDE